MRLFTVSGLFLTCVIREEMVAVDTLRERESEEVDFQRMKRKVEPNLGILFLNGNQNGIMLCRKENGNDY